MRNPEPESVWRHDKSGEFYVVQLLTNMDSAQPERYPPTVVYKVSNGSIWSAPLSGWHDRMTKVARPALKSMLDRKTDDIVERLGYVKVGYVLKHEDPQLDICVVDAGAVAWFRPEQWQWLMHNRDHVEFEWPKPIGALKK